MADGSFSGTEIRTFLIADVRGYTRFTQEHGDEAGQRSALAAVPNLRDAVWPATPEFGGMRSSVPHGSGWAMISGRISWDEAVLAQWTEEPTEHLPAAG